MSKLKSFQVKVTQTFVYDIDESADIQTKKMLRLRLEDLEKDYKLFLEIEKEL